MVCFAEKKKLSGLKLESIIYKPALALDDGGEHLRPFFGSQ